MKASLFHLENAINNLLDNARKYGDGSLIRLTAYKEGNRLHLRIHNGGVPIPGKALENIFKKYYRVSDGDRTRVRGYGLGLSYVKTVAERHKGKVSVRSDAANGTEVEFIVPLDQTQN